MQAIKEAFIYVVQVVFLVGAVVCLGAVIPVTAYRLFKVLFEPGDEQHPAQETPAKP